jgi:hypothetical protein
MRHDDLAGQCDVRACPICNGASEPVRCEERAPRVMVGTKRARGGVILGSFGRRADQSKKRVRVDRGRSTILPGAQGELR